MHRELKPEDMLYSFNIDKLDLNEGKTMPSVYDSVYNKIKIALDIDKVGYNVYIIDDFCREKMEDIIKFIKTQFKGKDKPKDICYVSCENDKIPKVVVTDNGVGIKFKKIVEDIQEVYFNCTFEFYNGYASKDKEELIDKIQKRRSDIVGKLIKLAKDDGFEMKVANGGFSFVPMKEGDLMSESDYDTLEEENKCKIINKITKLKMQVQDELEKMKDDEGEELDEIKDIMSEYLSKNLEEKKEEYKKLFKNENEILEYLDLMCSNIESKLSEEYTINYDEIEEVIAEVIYKYVVNVIVDNSANDSPQVIFEEDPNINNLLGNIDYENKNGVYITDVSLIKAGSLLKANEGCLIVRLNDLLSNVQAYYYLKKALMSEKVDLDYNKGYLELLSLSGLKPQPINIREKIILIGDAESYDLLYAYDEDFKKIFKIKAEFNPIIDINMNAKCALVENIYDICKSNKFKPLNDDAIKEVAKYMSRKAEDRFKFNFDIYELNKLLTLSNNIVNKRSQEYIEGYDIINTAYEEELIEKDILENYKNGKILIEVIGLKVGAINALSVIDIGYYSFGKPLRLTCSCYKGEGNIIDVQKESNMSGNIHIKSVNILKGYIKNILGEYNSVPIDFHISFEQLYGKIDGDSASVAELISMISALSKIPVKQNIAVTGSINQFGEVQPIGGVNDKIEGFFKVCKLLDTTEGKGVLIPESNINNLVLSNEVEKEIKKGNFHIYSMNNINDALDVLMGSENMGSKEIIDEMIKESKKYEGKKRNSKNKI